MQNYVDFFVRKVRAKRGELNITQQELADMAQINIRTVSELERGKSTPRFDTVAVIASCLDISLDTVIFQDTKPTTLPKCVTDFFADKSSKDAQKYIQLCQQIENTFEK